MVDVGLERDIWVMFIRHQIEQYRLKSGGTTRTHPIRNACFHFLRGHNEYEMVQNGYISQVLMLLKKTFERDISICEMYFPFKNQSVARIK